MTLEEVKEEEDAVVEGDDSDEDDLPLMEKKKYPPLPVSVKLSYAFGEVGGYVCSAIENLFLPSFLLEVASLAASKTALILLIAQLYSAFVGPFIGYFSDQTRTRWGRRKPWIAAATLPLALSWFALWENPGKYLMLYYLVCLILYNTFHSMFVVTYTALTPEITPDYDQRSMLTVYRFVGNMSAALLFTFIHSTLIESFKDPADTELIDYEKGYRISSIVIAGLIVFSGVVTVVGVPGGRLPKKRKQTKNKFLVFLDTVRKLFRVRAFVALAFLYFIGWSSVCFIQANVVLYLKYGIHQENHTSFVLLLVQLFAVIGFPFWGYLTRNIEKKYCFFLGTALFVPVSIGLFFLPVTTHLWTILTFGAFVGFAISMLFVIPWTMVPDVIDLSELQLGERKDGIVYSVFIVCNRFGVAASLFLSSFFLSLAGYENPSTQTQIQQDENYQPDKVLLLIRALVSLIPCGLVLLACVPVMFYDLTREKHEEIMRLVEIERERKTEILRKSKLPPQRPHEDEVHSHPEASS